jgi:hypothetical protein
VEATLYLPPTLAWSTAEARKLFSELWRLRKQWTVQEEESPAVVVRGHRSTATQKLRIERVWHGATGKWPLNDGQPPNFRGVRVHVSTGYNPGERNRFVSHLTPKPHHLLRGLSNES